MALPSPASLAALRTPITLDRVCEAVERRHTSLDDPGFCVICGAAAEGVEGDAQGYDCEACGAPGVWGDEDLLIYLA